MGFSHLLNDTETYAFGIDSLIHIAEVAATLKDCLLQSRSLLLSVFSFIEAHYQDSISLRDVAEAVGRSPAYLTDLVRRLTGKTVLCWIVEYRMAEARRLLLKTDQSVEQIVKAVGYVDRRHFSRQFVRLHGMTPQKWRRTHQCSSNRILEVDFQTVRPSELIFQRAMTMTATDAQRLQACVQEITAILYKNTGSDARSENLKPDNAYLQRFSGN